MSGPGPQFGGHKTAAISTCNNAFEVRRLFVRGRTSRYEPWVNTPGFCAMYRKGNDMFQSEVADFLDGTADAGFAVTMNGVICCCNAAAADFFGRSASDMVGRHC